MDNIVFSLLPVLVVILSTLLLFNRPLKRYLNKLSQDRSPRSPILENARKIKVKILVNQIDLTLERREIILMYPNAGKVFTNNMRKSAERTRQIVQELWEKDGEKEFYKAYYCKKMSREDRQELIQTLLWECQKNIEPYTTTGCISNDLCPELCPRVLNFLGDENSVAANTTSSDTASASPQSGVELLLETIFDASFLAEISPPEQDRDDPDFHHSLSFWYVPVISAIPMDGGNSFANDSKTSQTSNAHSNDDEDQDKVNEKSQQSNDETLKMKVEIEEFLSTLKKLIYVTFLYQFLRRYGAKKKGVDWKSVSLYIGVGALLLVAPFMYEAVTGSKFG